MLAWGASSITTGKQRLHQASGSKQLTTHEQMHKQNRPACAA